MFEIISVHGKPFKNTSHEVAEVRPAQLKIRKTRSAHSPKLFSSLLLLAFAALAGSGFVWVSQRYFFLRQRAELSEPEAQYRLGKDQYEAAQTPADYQAAVGWLEKAAAKGHVDAQATLGLVYSRGKGVTRDLQQARKWFAEAAENKRQPQELVLQPAKVPTKLNVFLNWPRTLEANGARIARKNLQVAALTDRIGRELTTRDGTKYRAVRVQKVEPAAITITFISEKGSPGFAKLKRENLSDELAVACRYVTDKNVMPFSFWAGVDSGDSVVAKARM